MLIILYDICRCIDENDGKTWLLKQKLQDREDIVKRYLVFVEPRKTAAADTAYLSIVLTFQIRFISDMVYLCKFI